MKNNKVNCRGNKMKKSGVYEIINTVTGDFYIGSTIDLKRRRREHFNESYWKHNPNKQLYKDMKQYGKDNFLFKTIQLCESDELKKYEQIAIEKYNPQYNICAAYTGLSKEEYQKKYNKQYYKENTDKIKQYNKQYYKENADEIKQHQKQYKKQYYKGNADKIKQYNKQYYKENTDKIKQYRKENADNIKQYHKQYYKENTDKIKQYRKQKCLYENEILSLGTLSKRFSRQGIEHPVLEAKKYLIGE